MIKKITGFEGFEGHVTIDLGKYRQRMLELSSLSLKFDTNGSIELNTSDSLKEIIKLYDLIHTKVTEINLKHIKSGKTFVALDDLEDHHEYGAVMTKLVTEYSQGESLGNY